MFLAYCRGSCAQLIFGDGVYGGCSAGYKFGEGKKNAAFEKCVALIQGGGPETNFDDQLEEEKRM